MRQLSLITATVGPFFPVPVSQFWSNRKRHPRPIT